MAGKDGAGKDSAGKDGAVYQWNLADGKREGEYVTKSCNYSCVRTNGGGNLAYAVGSDGLWDFLSPTDRWGFGPHLDISVVGEAPEPQIC